MCNLVLGLLIASAGANASSPACASDAAQPPTVLAQAGGVTYALSRDTGAVLWAVAEKDIGAPLAGSPVRATDGLFLLLADGSVHRLALPLKKDIGAPFPPRWLDDLRDWLPLPLKKDIGAAPAGPPSRAADSLFLPLADGTVRQLPLPLKK